MNANPHIYESFPTRLQRLIDEAKMTATDLAAKIGVGKSTVSKYLSGNAKPALETLVAIADTLEVTTDYLLCRKSAVLSMHAPKDDIYIFESSEFDFKLLTNEYDNFLAAMLDGDDQNEAVSRIISQITLLLTIHLRDSSLIYKRRFNISEEQFSAFYIRSGEMQKIISHLLSQLSLDVIARSGMNAKFAAAGIDLNSSIKGLIGLFAIRSEALRSTVIDKLLLTLEHSTSQAIRPPGRPALK
jgi:transcriptional regulator with XRE-family HTH domain